MCNTHSTALSLPFTSMRDGKPLFWAVTASGDWTRDCARGKECARAYVERARSGQQVPELAWVVRDMIAAGRWTGVECAFVQSLHRLGEQVSKLL